MDIKEFDKKLSEMYNNKYLKINILCEDNNTHQIVVDGEDVSHKAWAIIFSEEKE